MPNTDVKAIRVHELQVSKSQRIIQKPLKASAYAKVIQLSLKKKKNPILNSASIFAKYEHSALTLCHLETEKCDKALQP